MHYPVVVVEDEAATRKLLQVQLKKAGYNVVACADGREALEPITNMGSGIVLADWSMPVMDGLELCGAVRELEGMEALGHIYFILLTAHDTKEQTVQGLESGANDYLTKPYHPGELLARIHVGERILRLQEELLQRTLEYHKTNSQLAMLSRKLEEAANTDALTGLANRRCLFDRFQDAWEQTARNQQPLSCIMLDIDKFKHINDTFGHDAGDQVLREVAEIVRRGAPRPEHCGRFGGEEFVVLCPNCTAHAAVDIADTIRRSIEERTTIFNNQIISPTISCGVAERSAEMPCPDTLLKHADEMLYAAKTNGRNQVWVRDAHATENAADAIVKTA